MCKERSLSALLQTLQRSFFSAPPSIAQTKEGEANRLELQKEEGNEEGRGSEGKERRQARLFGEGRSKEDTQKEKWGMGGGGEFAFASRREVFLFQHPPSSEPKKEKCCWLLPPSE